MDDQQYKREMETLERMLEEIDKQIQIMVDHMANRAWLAYPNEHIDTELYTVKKRLTMRADKIIDRMQELHKAFHTRPAKKSL